MSTRAPPPRAGQQMAVYNMTPRMMRRSLRPAVLIASIINAVLSLFWGIGAFKDLTVDKNHGYPKLGTLDIILGSLYFLVCGLELIGTFAAYKNTVRWSRLFAFFSILATVVLVGTFVVRVVVHFVFKSDLINECTAITSGEDITFRFGIWGPTVSENLSPTEAHNACVKGFNHDTFTEIMTLLFQLVIGGVTIFISWAYYQQMLDPSTGRTQARPALDDYESQGASYPLQYHPAYAPPAGPPPAGPRSKGVYSEDPELEGGYGGYEPPAYGSSIDKASGEASSKEDPFADFDEPVNGVKYASESRETLA